MNFSLDCPWSLWHWLGIYTTQEPFMQNSHASLTRFSSRNLSFIETSPLRRSYFSLCCMKRFCASSIRCMVLESRGPFCRASRSQRYASYSTLVTETTHIHQPLTNSAWQRNNNIEHQCISTIVLCPIRNLWGPLHAENLGCFSTNVCPQHSIAELWHLWYIYRQVSNIRRTLVGN